MKSIATLSLILTLSISGIALAQSSDMKNMDMKDMDMKNMPMDKMSSDAGMKATTH